jgi:hypothetical protein
MVAAFVRPRADGGANLTTRYFGIYVDGKDVMDHVENPGRPFRTDTEARRKQSARCVHAARAAARLAAVAVAVRLVGDDRLPLLWPPGNPDDPE